MKEADIHPCFSCALPDCDEQSPKCGLRRAQREYTRHLRSGDGVPSTVRAKYSIAYRELYYDRKQEKKHRRTAV
jgi:hypothetical protein